MATVTITQTVEVEAEIELDYDQIKDAANEVGLTIIDLPDPKNGYESIKRDLVEKIAIKLFNKYSISELEELNVKLS